MTTSSTYGRHVIETPTNKSGGGVIKGDVVIVDTGNDYSFTTSTAGAFTGTIGIAQETIANNAAGRVLTSGYADLVNVNASVTRGNFGKTHTVAKQATDAGSSRAAGSFCQFWTGGTTPTAHLFGLADNTSGAGTGTLTTVKDEGTNLSTAVASIDFVGAGVTATGTTAVTVTIPGGAVTEATLSGPVTMTSANTLYDGPSLVSLAAGTYLIQGHLTINPGTVSGGYTFISGRIDSGGTVVDEAETLTTLSGSSCELTFFAPLVLGSATTVKLRVASSASTGGSILRDNQTNSATSHTASRILALRIA